MEKKPFSLEGHELGRDPGGAAVLGGDANPQPFYFRTLRCPGEWGGFLPGGRQSRGFLEEQWE